MSKMINRLLLWVAVCLVLPMPFSWAADRDRRIITNPVYLKPQRLVAMASGRLMNIYCTGHGSPTVIFDSGLGEDLVVWAFVQPIVSKSTRSCSYDRAGLGFSQPSGRPGSSANAVEDLHKLLIAAHLKPPYILVGHSLGGMNIKLYAETHFDDIAGLVFVDPTHEDLAKRSWEIDPVAGGKYPSYIDFLHSCLRAKPADFVAGSKLKENCGSVPNADRLSAEINALELREAMTAGNMGAWISEQENVWSASADQLRAARRSLGEIPMIVLTHEPLPRGKNETQEMRDAQNQLRTEMHEDLAQMSSGGSVRVVKNSEHHFQLDQPQEVANAVLDVLVTARARARSSQ